MHFSSKSVTTIKANSNTKQIQQGAQNNNKKHNNGGEKLKFNNKNNSKQQQQKPVNFQPKKQQQPSAKEKKQQAEEAPTPIDENLCAICHTGLPESKCDIAKTNCKHEFCYTCILEWVTKYKTECPSCRTKVTKLTKEDGSNFEQEIDEIDKKFQPEAAEHMNSEENAYSCLGHEYFLSEISQLLQQTNRLQEMLRPFVASAKSNVKYGNLKKNFHNKLFDEYQDIKNTLLCLEQHFVARNFFDGLTTLQNLHQLQDRLRTLNSQQESPYAETPAEDDEDEYYEEYAYEEEEYYEDEPEDGNNYSFVHHRAYNSYKSAHDHYDY